MSPIVVVGPMRSGTSLVAGLLHHLGVSMGVSMVMPVPGTDPEYEDLGLVAGLARWALYGGEAPRSEYFLSYARLRGRGTGLVWGVKSPFLVLAREWVEAWPEAVVIVCEREESETRASLRRVVGDSESLRVFQRLQTRIFEALPKLPAGSVRVSWRDAQADPEGLACELSGLVGLEPGAVVIRQAVERVFHGRR